MSAPQTDRDPAASPAPRAAGGLKRRSATSDHSHSQWHHVELFCPECEAWRQSGAASTREGFEAQGRALVSGRCVLKPCDHVIVAKADGARFGSEIARFHADVTTPAASTPDFNQ